MPKVRTQPKKSGNFRPLLEDFQREVLTELGQFAVDRSPVDTSAYVDSHTFIGAQGFSSHGRPRNQDAGEARARNKSRIADEVRNLDVSGRVVFENNAPHAGIVETKHGYQVYAQTRREFTRITREALFRMRGSR